MPEEVVTLTAMPVTVDAKTAEDRGDNFTPTDDELPLDNNGDSRDATPAAPAPAPAASPAVAATDDAEEVARQNNGQIPKSRFNEVNEARKQAVAEAERLRAELAAAKVAPAAAPATAPAPPAAAPAAEAFDVLGQERAYADALMEGDIEKALKIRGGINEHLSTTAEERATTRVRSALTQEQQASALQEASNQALIDFPFLNTTEGATALQIIVATRDHLIRNDGMKPHLALKKAVADIAPRFAPAPATPSKDLPAAAPAQDTRSAEALRRGAQDSELQAPAAVAGIGNRATQARIDVKNLTEKQFEELPEAEKKRLRGD